MAQFNHFDDLPKELRDQIWDMAIRNDKPAVHFFTVYDVWNDSDSVVDPAKKVHATADPYYHIPMFRTGLAAPRDPRGAKLSWTDGNISTYLTDSGLWTACHESRERMVRHFKPYKTSPLISRHIPVNLRTVRQICDKPTASVNMGFIGDDNKRQYLTVRPHTDLICLQLPKNSNISYDKGGFDWKAIGNFPSFRWHSGQGLWHSSDIHSVAVEYDPAWEDCDPRKGFAGVSHAFTHVGEIQGLMEFWFIDYRLTRKYKPERPWQRTFHAGKLTFIEVSWGDPEWCRCPKEGCSDECFSSGRDCTMHGPHGLVYDLDMYHDQRDDMMYGSDIYHQDLYGVLACVDLELEGKLPTQMEFFEMNVHRKGFRRC
ncbi:hypothetical protein Daus18300_011922 [Diaporthe australafricana]|uniref:2EXR domain-containing protein n=1 Tax=Diaporthe australafricana TaxID=127596 RepID=A0ABR3W4M0_9PEZI